MLEAEEEIPLQDSSLAEYSLFFGGLIIMVILFYVALGPNGIIVSVIIGATLYLGGKLNRIIQLLEKNTSTDLELPLK